ncbi:MAG: hypothetical protein GX237_04245, partial [Clostridiales bacterium]|nr:hypothetical protein [Clostridiales bacterium]
LNCVGAYVTTSTTTVFICVEGLAMVVTDTDVYEGDIIITAANGKFERSVAPTAGTVVGKVVRAGETYSLVDLN